MRRGVRLSSGAAEAWPRQTEARRAGLSSCRPVCRARRLRRGRVAPTRSVYSGSSLSPSRVDPADERHHSLVLEPVEAHEQAFLQVGPQVVGRHLADEVLELAMRRPRSRNRAPCPRSRSRDTVSITASTSPSRSTGVPAVVLIVRMASLRSSRGPTLRRRGPRGSCAPRSSSASSRRASGRPTA